MGRLEQHVGVKINAVGPDDGPRPPINHHLREIRQDPEFDYPGSRRRITVLDPLVGKSGWLTCVRATLTGLDAEDTVLLAAIDEAGSELDGHQGERLLGLPAVVRASAEPSSEVRQVLDGRILPMAAVLAEAEELKIRSGGWFQEETDKLDQWAEDRRTSLRDALENLDRDIRDTKRAARSAPTLPEKLELQRKTRRLEEQRDASWRDDDATAREIERQKDQLLDQTARRLESRTERESSVHDSVAPGLDLSRWTICRKRANISTYQFD